MSECRSWADIVAERPHHQALRADAWEFLPFLAQQSSPSPSSILDEAEEGEEGDEAFRNQVCWFHCYSSGGCDRRVCRFMHVEVRTLSFHDARRVKQISDRIDQAEAWRLGVGKRFATRAPSRSVFPLPPGCAMPCVFYANNGRCSRDDACPWPHFTTPCALEWRPVVRNHH